MDRNTNLRDMDAPGVASGKEAGDTILAPKGLANYPSSAEKGSNSLEEYVTEKQPTAGAGGQAKFK
jgi:hypothetical protein